VGQGLSISNFNLKLTGVMFHNPTLKPPWMGVNPQNYHEKIEENF
jgi:hypothetical protein